MWFALWLLNSTPTPVILPYPDRTMLKKLNKNPQSEIDALKARIRELESEAQVTGGMWCISFVIINCVLAHVESPFGH